MSIVVVIVVVVHRSDSKEVGVDKKKNHSCREKGWDWIGFNFLSLLFGHALHCLFLLCNFFFFLLSC